MKGHRIHLAILAITLAGLLISPGMALVLDGGYGMSSPSKTAVISDYTSLKTIKQNAMSGYTLSWKPDISVFTRDTTIHTDPALIASWQTSARSVSSGQMASYGMFTKRPAPSCGCGGC